MMMGAQTSFQRTLGMRRYVGSSVMSVQSSLSQPNRAKCYFRAFGSRIATEQCRSPACVGVRAFSHSWTAWDRNCNSRTSTETCVTRASGDSEGINSVNMTLRGACRFGQTGTVNKLLLSAADVNFCTNDGESHLLTAVFGGYAKTVGVLLRYRADANKQRLDGICPLIVASERGYIEIVEMLLRSKAIVDIRDQRFRTPLYWASEKGQESIVKLLAEHNADPNACANDGTSCLLAAVFGGHTGTVCELVQREDDVNRQRNDGCCPLIAASGEGYVDILEILLNSGADIDIRDRQYRTPLYHALWKRQTKSSELLCEYGADVKACTDDGASCLLAALFSGPGQKSIISALLEKGADANKQRIDGACPLIVACEHGYVDIVDMLLKNNARIDIRDEHGRSPLWLASYQGNAETVKLLMEHGADVNACKENGQSCLLAAIFGGLREVVLTLLDSGADIRRQRSDGTCAIVAASQVGDVFLLKTMLQKEAERSDAVVCPDCARFNVCLHARRSDNLTAPDIARFNGFLEVVNDLRQHFSYTQYGQIDLKNIGDINTESVFATTSWYCFACEVWNVRLLTDVESDGSFNGRFEILSGDARSEMHFAVRTGCVDLLTQLIQRGADVNAADVHGNTPLHEAACHSLNVVELLVIHGADVNAQNNQGKTPLHVACFYDNTDVVSFLSEQKNTILLRDIWSNTPLHYLSRKVALLYRHEVTETEVLPNIVGIYAYTGMKANEKCEKVDLLGNTELHRAVGVYGAMKMLSVTSDISEEIDFLLEKRGLDINSQNNCGLTPLHVARGPQAIKALLLRADSESLSIKDNRGRNFWHMFATKTIRLNLEFIMNSRATAISEGSADLDHMFRTPLHYAAITGNKKLARLLLEVAPDSITKQDMFGRTPMHYAAIDGVDPGTFFGVDTVRIADVSDTMNKKVADYQQYHDSFWRNFRAMRYFPSRNLTSAEFPQIIKAFNQIRCNSNPSEYRLFNDVRHPDHSADYMWDILLNRCKYNYKALADKHTRCDNRGKALQMQADMGSVLEYTESLFSEISKTVQKAMENLAEEISKRNSQLECKVVPVGSAYEGTKVGCCDEFDFDFVLTSISRNCEVSHLSDLPSGYVQLRAKHPPSNARFWNSDGTLNSHAVRFMFEATVRQILMTSTFEKENNLEYVDTVDYINITTSYIPTKINVRATFKFPTPVCGYHILHAVNVDIVPVIEVSDWYPAKASHNVQWGGEKQQTQCQYVFRQPQSTHPRVSWSGCCMDVSFAQAESACIRKSPLVVRAAYMVVKYLVKYSYSQAWFPTYAVKTAVLYSLKDEELEQCSGSTFCDIDKNELAYWVRKIMKRLLCFAVQDYYPIYFMPDVNLPVWQFEQYLKYSHIRLHQHKLTFSDILQPSFYKNAKNKKLRDIQLELILKAFICSHLMYWNVLTDADSLRVYIPPINDPNTCKSCWHLFE